MTEWHNIVGGEFFSSHCFSDGSMQQYGYSDGIGISDGISLVL
jgi:hypothetical protein